MKLVLGCIAFIAVFGAIGVSAASIETPRPGFMTPIVPTWVDCRKTCNVSFYDAAGNAATVHVRSPEPVSLWTTFKPAAVR
jgi:hypothetical protein